MKRTLIRWMIARLQNMAWRSFTMKINNRQTTAWRLNKKYILVEHDVSNSKIRTYTKRTINR